MGLPVQAKGTTPVSSTPPKPSKAVAKTPAVPVKPTPTQDISRSSVTVAKPAGHVGSTTTAVVTHSTAALTPACHSNAAATVAKTYVGTSSVSVPASHATLNSSRSSIVVSSSHTSASGRPNASERLARLTAYWSGEGDYYTGRGISSTGIHLHGGHCAVDPRIIPYGSVVDIAGVGKYLAVDTGSAVISREAARETGHNSEERNALVIDLYFESRSDGEHFAANGPKFASISWTAPSATGAVSPEAHTLFADENWTKIQNKQL